ncbi:MAG: hypothetical protein LBR16_04605 [Treponema sp.]|jgi:hypothetical protein|nr:hypothetical protein [Treponema sp.]
MKNKYSTSAIIMMAGALGLALTLVMTAAGCGTRFDGTSLVGTTWVGEVTDDYSQFGAGQVTTKRTAKFTSDTAGTQEIKVSKWSGEWSDDGKKKAQGLLDALTGDFTYTYDAENHSGNYSSSKGAGGRFQIDVEKREISLPGNSSDKPVVLKLK